MSLQPQQFQQLQMFMKPSEIRSSHAFGDKRTNETVDDLAERKLREADRINYTPWSTEREPLTDAIEREGVREPVTLDPDELADGHHRFFVADRQESRGKEVYLPVQHQEGWFT